MLFVRPQLPSAAIIVAIGAAATTVRFLHLRLSHSPSNNSISSKICPSTGGSIMDSSVSSLLVLCCKSPEDNEFAQSLESKWNALKLLGGEENEEVRVLMYLAMGSTNQPTFQTQLYMKALSTSNFGKFLIWSPCLSSTHNLITQKFGEIPMGSVCVADVQFKGRGVARNVWESPIGSLLFSFTLQMDDVHTLPLLQYVVSLAVIEAIKEACQAKGLPKLDVRIKWPNDIYLNGLKVGGILCTSTYKRKKFNICVGVGLNVDNKHPTTCLNAVLQDISSGSHQLMREDILASFFNKFEKLFAVLMNKGFQDLEDLYYKTWLHSGQRILIEEHEEQSAADMVSVTIQGLTSSGYLLATDEDNKTYELRPDGNSFDFFKGLVRRKIV